MPTLRLGSARGFTLSPDVIVIGDGLIGSSIAMALVDRGARVTIVSRAMPGPASPAAAGLLAPSIERAARHAADFAVASRAAFPAFVQGIEERSGMRVPLQRDGILEIALDAEYAAALRAELPATATWLDDREVHELEPHVARTQGGVLWEEDGCVDNVALLTAVRAVVRGHERARIVDAIVTAVSVTDGAPVVLAEGRGPMQADHVVLAAGAWSGRIAGAPLASVVEPVRGQMVQLDRSVLRRPVYCDDSYIVPRNGKTLVGSTMERVGFEAGTTESAVEGLCQAAGTLAPPLAGVTPERAWAGLRPVTPDLLPMIGPDPERPALIYACGHSRNGVLMAPSTAVAVSEMIFEASLTFNLRQFRPDRFRGTFRQS